MDRKAFMKTCGCSLLSASVLATLLQSCAKSNYFVQATPENHQLTLKKSVFTKSENGIISERPYVLVETAQFDFPICLYKVDDSNYSALLMQCPHKGCELQPNGSFLVCPCHGSEFSNKGVVQNPPAEENLRSFPVKSDDENIYIQL